MKFHIRHGKAKLKSVSKILKKHKYVVLVIFNILFISCISGYVAYGTYSNKHVDPTKPIEKTQTQKPKETPKPAEQPTPTSTPAATTPPTPAPQAKTTTPAAKPKPGAPSTADSYCTTHQNRLYIEYNTRIQINVEEHTEVLALLQQLYDNGEYADQSMGDNGYNAWQQDVTAENERFQQKAAGIYATNQAELAAIGCK